MIIPVNECVAAERVDFDVPRRTRVVEMSDQNVANSFARNDVAGDGKLQKLILEKNELSGEANKQ